MKTQNRLFLIWIIFCATVAIGQVHGDILWDVTFENPPHTNGSPVTTGLGSDRVSGDKQADIAFGLGDFTSQVAVLHADGTWSAMWFAPSQIYTSGIHRISWDLAPLSWVGGNDQFTVSVLSANDPGGEPYVGVQYDYFTNYTMHLYIEGAEVANMGPCVLGEQDHFETTIDLDGDWVSFSLNGSVVYSNSLTYPERDIEQFRINTGTLVDPTLAVDNFQWEIIPEPSTNALLFLGGAGFALKWLYDKHVCR